MVHCGGMSQDPVQYQSILVEARRGGIVESRHEVVAVIVDEEGSLLACYGDCHVTTCWRSSAKPFQAVPWVRDGTVDHFGWGAPELALMCASHVGDVEHVSRARRMLADIGLKESDLRCGRRPSAAHECSGNHIGMLAACVKNGWDVASYQALDHPSQLACLEAVAEAAGLRPDEVVVGVDGCGVAAFATPIAAAARAYARLPKSCARIADAMRAHPSLVMGAGKLDTVVMQVFPGAISKQGAEGLGCVRLPDGRAVVLKALDGADRAIPPAQTTLLAHLLGVPELPPAAARLARRDTLNDRRAVVGELAAVLPAQPGAAPSGRRQAHA